MESRSYQSEVFRALSVLGYQESEHDLGTFSRWIDSIRNVEQSEEMKSTWREFMTALFGGVASMTRATVDEAAQAATYACVLQVRTFPPRTELDDGPDIDACGDSSSPWCEHVEAEAQRWQRATSVDCPDAARELIVSLREWETAAKQRGWLRPEDMRGYTALDVAEEQKRWQLATRRSTPDEAKELFVSLSDERSQWRAATNRETPELTAEMLRQIEGKVAEIDERNTLLQRANFAWRKATNCAEPGDIPDQIRKWQESAAKGEATKWQRATGCSTPDEARKRWDAIDSDRKFWQSETGCTIPTGAGSLIRHLRGCERTWMDATGCNCPGDAEKRIKDQLRELEQQSRYMNALDARLTDMNKALSTAEKRRDELAAMLMERDQDLLSANAEIDKVRKAAQTLGLISDQSKELAKVRAELATKAREAQTEKERADAELKRRVDTETYLYAADEALFAVCNERTPFAKIAERIAGIASKNDSELCTMRDDAADVKLELHDAKLALNIVRDAFIKKISGVQFSAEKWRDVAWEMEKRIETAIFPLPKPGRTDFDQRWAYIRDLSYENCSHNNHPHNSPDFGTASDLLNGDHWLFLGQTPKK